MAVWDGASIQANRRETSLLRGDDEPSVAEASDVEPEVPDKWHPAATLAFIVLSCGLLWGGIFVALGLIF